MDDALDPEFAGMALPHRYLRPVSFDHKARSIIGRHQGALAHTGPLPRGDLDRKGIAYATGDIDFCSHPPQQPQAALRIQTARITCAVPDCCAVTDLVLRVMGRVEITTVHMRPGDLNFIRVNAQADL